MLQRTSVAYMRGDCTVADKILLERAGLSFVNFTVAAEPTMAMTLEQRCACTLTRIAFLLGSTDNITCLVGIVDGQ